MAYIENPKTKGSGILCAIPQGPESLPCPGGCQDCFFQGGRSYLEPLAENLPNMPNPEIARRFIVRVNDGLDSLVNFSAVQERTDAYPNKFYNTIALSLRFVDARTPIVLTVNPGKYTDEFFYTISGNTDNLMFVRFRANVWNRYLLDAAIEYYTKIGVPLVITFMRYYRDLDIIQSITDDYSAYYTYKDHVLNPSWAINQAGWNLIYGKHRDNPLVSTCGRDAAHHLCRDCGVCLREYWATKARLHAHG